LNATVAERTSEIAEVAEASVPGAEHLPHDGIDACTGACSECESARSPHQ
jgi:hypothetical protein